MSNRTKISIPAEKIESMSHQKQNLGTYAFVSGIEKNVFYNTEIQEHYQKYGFVEFQNRYWFGSIISKGGENDKETAVGIAFKEVSNFTIRPLLLIESNNDAKRVYEITNTRNQTKIKAFSPVEFANAAAFSQVVESMGNYNFYATKSQYSKLKNKLYELCESALEIKTLGYHPDGFYAFCNGISNGQWIPTDEKGYGIVAHNGQQYFIPAMSKIFSADTDEYQNHKLFINKAPFQPIDFQEYARHFCNVYSQNNNGRIGLLYYITCLFRDIVYGHFRFFPHLFLFGPAQSGKSTLAWSIMHLFGNPRLPFMLNTGTPVAFYKQFAEFSNAVVWFDEYQNSIDYQRIQSLKTAYDGAGHTKSDNTKDNRNRSIPVKSGCIISGQELPTADVALFTRCILLQFIRTDYSEQEKNIHSKFNSEIEISGVSYITAFLTQFRQHFQGGFQAHFDREFQKIKQYFSHRGIDDRIAKNMAILLSTYSCLSEKVEFPFSLAEARETAYDIIAAQNSMIAASKETATFWKMVMYMHRKGEIMNEKDYRIQFRTFLENPAKRGKPKFWKDLRTSEHKDGQDILFIRLTNIHTSYLKLCRERGEKAMDEASLRHYLTNSKEFICQMDNLKFDKRSTTSLAFSYNLLCESIEDFSIGSEEEVENIEANF